MKGQRRRQEKNKRKELGKGNDDKHLCIGKWKRNLKDFCRFQGLLAFLVVAPSGATCGWLPNLLFQCRRLW
ncbi:hypothetical protein NC651_029215 [Populus alba x Populus x berolinensis]|nr:hypothetical protein NC651_029203 [Populus alba x Populus x berolinensis]KAJ6882871.1 hypothetical protein NC651_029215 [Populus alba x Populus x berolinensis]